MGADVVRRWGPETRQIVHSIFVTLVPVELRRIRAGTDGALTIGDTDAYLRRVPIIGCEGLLQSLRTDPQQDSCRPALQGASAIPGHGKEDVSRTGRAPRADGDRSTERSQQNSEVPPVSCGRDLYR